MHKLMVLYPKPSDPAEFERYYRETHLELVRRLPGIRDIQFALGIESGPYWGFFEGTFDTSAAFAEAMASPAGAAVGADVPNYATGGAEVLDFPIETP